MNWFSVTGSACMFRWVHLNLAVSCLLLSGMVALFFALQLAFSPAAFAFSNADLKSALKLNLQQGPLGVTLSLRGKNVHPGQATLSFIDANSVPGPFTAPSDTSVQVQNDGTFISSNLIMPSNGPAGSWEIVVTDSADILTSIRYEVLAAPGQQEAGAPSMVVNPASGMRGDAISFAGDNWLPGGTSVNLMLLVGTISIPLLDKPISSDASGVIAGTFHLPTNLTASQVTVNATDVATGALRASAQVVVLNPSPTTSPTATGTVTPTASPTVTATPPDVTTPTVAPTPTSTSTPVPVGAGSTNGILPPLDWRSWGLGLLIAGGALAIAAFMLILFLIPWSEGKQDLPRGGQS
jgi:hypothetical protein